MCIMNGKDIPEIKKILEEWEKEVDQLETLQVNGNVLDNSLNSKRIALEVKYKKRIKEVIEKHSS